MTFQEILNSDDINVRELGQRACELKLLLDNHQISEPEFDELLEDLKSLKYINGQMNHLILLNDLRNVMASIDLVRHWAP